jgi:hypothetical protein
MHKRQVLEGLVNTRPEARDAFVFGMRLVIESRLDESYFLANLDQNKKATDLFNQIKNLKESNTMTSGERRAFLPNQIKLLELAALSHRKVAEQHRQLTIQPIPAPYDFQSRRHNHLNFNRGMKAFYATLRQLLAGRQDFSTFTSQLDAVSYQLECAWMLLFHDPTVINCGVSDDNLECANLEQLGQAYDNHDRALFRDKSQALLALPGVSLISKSAVSIIGGQDDEVIKGVEDLISIQREAMTNLNSKVWMQFLGRWMVVGTRELAARNLPPPTT